MDAGAVWFSDLEKALAAFHEKLPEIQLFNSIEGNIYGDFLITYGKDKYIVVKETWKVYKFNNDAYRWEAI